MTGSTRYSVPEHVVTAQLAGEAVLLHLETKRYFRLNLTGAAVWQGLEAGLEVSEIAHSLARRFTVDPETALVEVERLVRELLEQQLITR